MSSLSSRPTFAEPALREPMNRLRAVDNVTNLLYLAWEYLCLAAVIGGTSMSGGRFSLPASVVGALAMQAVTQSMYAIGVPAFALTAIKAVVVIVVILLFSEQARAIVMGLGARKREA